MYSTSSKEPHKSSPLIITVLSPSQHLGHKLECRRMVLLAQEASPYLSRFLAFYHPHMTWRCLLSIWFLFVLFISLLCFYSIYFRRDAGKPIFSSQLVSWHKWLLSLVTKPTATESTLSVAELIRPTSAEHRITKLNPPLPPFALQLHKGAAITTTHCLPVDFMLIPV